MDPVSASTPKRRRTLNITAIKCVIVACVGLVTAVGSAVSGVGAQVGFAPMLTWMLGLGAEKAQATALRFAVLAAAAAALGAYVERTMHPAAMHLPMGAGTYVAAAFAIAVAATIGAVFAAPVARRFSSSTARRLFQVLGVWIGLIVLVNTARHGGMWNTVVRSPISFGWLPLIGFAVGGLTQVTSLAGGVLLVPALIYVGGLPAPQAAAISMLVIALAGALPAVSYASKGLVDPLYGLWAAGGGVVGGFCGGALLPFFSDRGVSVVFGLVAMFLSARELARISFERSAPAPPPRLDL